MHTIWNHEKRETAVEINGQAIRLAAGSCRTGLDSVAAKELLAAAKAQGVDWREQEVVSVRADGVAEVARDAAAAELAKLGRLVPLDLFTKTDLSALSRETLARLHDAAHAGATAPEMTKQQLVANLLAVSSNGRTPGQSPGASGSIPDAASNPPIVVEPTPSAGGNQAVTTGSAMDAAPKE